MDNKEEYIYLNQGDSLEIGQIYTYSENYICLIRDETDKNTYRIKNYIHNKELSNNSGTLNKPRNNTEYRYPTKIEKDHLLQCIKAGHYVDYIEYIPTIDELNLLSIIEESKKLSNID